MQAYLLKSMLKMTSKRKKMSYFALKIKTKKLKLL